MAASSAKHLKSLGSMKFNRALVHFLLEEADNERTHLFLWMNLGKPNALIRAATGLKQILLWNLLFVAYFISPYYVHRFVGYMEEESIFNYTMMLK